jgi:formamidopyrimidine-DNA glycosylase
LPEGVEVKLSAECIRPLVVNKLITKISVGDKSRYANRSPYGLEEVSNLLKTTEDSVGWLTNPLQVIDVKTKGKFMYWSLNNGWYMFCTFGMSGQWSPNPGKHVCLHIRMFDPYDIDGQCTEVYFNDPRHFGTIKFTNDSRELSSKLNELGWDPLTQPLPQDTFFNKLKRSSKPIGQVLMDQKLFAGVGNYIRAEALYRSKISPWRQTNMLVEESKILPLCQALVDVMQESYQHQGATIQTYTTVYGDEGRYSSCFKVYGQKTDPLGYPVVKQNTPEGRTIHWCPTIQL